MLLTLDPAENRPHPDWLRATPGGYEWWYADVLSDDGRWSLVLIFFLGNPFSPYARLASQKISADPLAHNAFFLALSRDARLHAYHFTRVPPAQICLDDARITFGENTLELGRRAKIRDENANRRTVTGEIIFDAPPSKTSVSENVKDAKSHLWHPAQPAARARVELVLDDPHSHVSERVFFDGDAYQDHNRGALPFDWEVESWHWARAHFPGGATAILYRTQPKNGPPNSQFLLFQNGELTHRDDDAQTTLAGDKINLFGTRYATRLRVQSRTLSAEFHLGARLDSAPFYIRTLASATLTRDGNTQAGRGFGEYFRPRGMTSALAASAMRARIVEK